MAETKTAPDPKTKAETADEPAAPSPAAVLKALGTPKLHDFKRRSTGAIERDAKGRPVVVERAAAADDLVSVRVAGRTVHAVLADGRRESGSL